MHIKYRMITLLFICMLSITACNHFYVSKPAPAETEVQDTVEQVENQAISEAGDNNKEPKSIDKQKTSKDNHNFPYPSEKSKENIAITKEYLGVWGDIASKRCHMTITSNDNIHLDIIIHWSNSMSEGIEWNVQGIYDSELDRVVYQGDQVDYYHIGKMKRETKRPASGFLYLNESKTLYWKDNVEDAGILATFEKNKYIPTDVEEYQSQVESQFPIGMYTSRSGKLKINSIYDGIVNFQVGSITPKGDEYTFSDEIHVLLKDKGPIHFNFFALENQEIADDGLEEISGDDYVYQMPFGTIEFDIATNSIKLSAYTSSLDWAAIYLMEDDYQLSEEF